MERVEILAKVKRGELKKGQAAKMMGVSHQRVSQLLKKEARKAMEAPKPPVITPDPLAEQHPAIPTTPSAPPASLAEVVSPDIASSPSAGATPLESKSPVEPPTPVEALPFDPEDAEAGREILRMARSACVRGLVKLFKIPYQPKEEDKAESLDEVIREENKILKMALKRNGEKVAGLGWLTKGWKGILFGIAIDVVRCISAIAPLIPQEPDEEGASPAPPPRTNGESVERPKTLAEKIAAAQQ